ncbi:DNA pilot protein [robinz microvirus RP_171]|nr:DNA pilot protein [robinz microvirus RP_171]
MGAASINAMGGLAIQSAKNKKQWKYQQKAMDKQEQMNREAWDMQNAYNTPTQQMDRLKQAGLNPRLIYGEGSSAPNLAGPMDVAEAPVRQASAPEMPDLFKYYQVRQMDAQYEQTVMATDIMQKRSGLMDIEQGLKNLDLMKETLRSQNYPSVVDLEQSMQRFITERASTLSLNEKRIGENLVTQGGLMDQLGTMRAAEITSQQLDNVFKTHRNELAKLGIYSSDNAGLRALIQGAKRMSISIDDLLENSAEKLQYLLKNQGSNKFLGKQFLKK